MCLGYARPAFPKIPSIVPKDRPSRFYLVRACDLFRGLASKLPQLSRLYRIMIARAFALSATERKRKTASRLESTESPLYGKLCVLTVKY